ncbi:MAG: VanZ family protein [Oscillospiraceae bacterium]|jgi:glycopeptide antibiotics resistance protein|nr:VanZ family protein [Oscillospiraceae bacterium]
MPFYVFGVLKHALYFLPAYALARVITIFALEKRGLKTTALREAGLLVLFLYLFALLHVTVNYVRLFGFDFQLAERYNLVPFAGLATVTAAGNTAYAVRNILGNIVLFVPLGVLLPLLWRRFTPVKTVIVGAALSLAIEVTQFFTGRGTDIDDLILNTLGTLCGCCVYLILRKTIAGRLNYEK